RFSTGGFSVRLPFALPQDLPPFWIRPTLPELVDYGAQTTILTKANFVRLDVGRSLPGFHKLATSYLSRGRLHPSFLLAHLDDLRDATRYWIDDCSKN